ncbi:transcriptional regulator [Streptosporangium violaceochromogenes]|nr:transcriptional regulator [Streptosporangium violaceochromogenes]
MDARLTGRALAALAGWHFTKISKIEHGHTMPTEVDLELWCFHCRAQSELPDLIATVRTIEKMYAEIRRLMRSGTARYQRELLDERAKSHRLRTFQISLIPGDLQTREYTTEILTDAARMLGHPADIEASVASRAERARLMRSGKRLYHILLCENVLRSGVVSPATMRGQLTHLTTLFSLPSVHLGIIPNRARFYMPMCAFWIFDDRHAEVETFSAIIKITQPREIGVYAKIFDHYAGTALYGQEARALVMKALHDLEQHGETS